MKKVLIIAYDYPPYNSIGAQRPYSWYRYLKEFGWEPIVVTRHWDNNIQNPIDYIKPSTIQKETIEIIDKGVIIRAPFKPNLRDKILLKYGFNKYKLFRKIITLIYQFGEFFVPFLDSRRTIYKASYNYLETHKVDVIIATGEPFILFKYASKLSKLYKIPWVADYRDGWSGNPSRKVIERKLYKILEERLISTSCLCITVSNPLKYQLEQLHSRTNIRNIQNGYDEDEFTNIKNKNFKTDKFKIAYAGIIYPYQRLEVFLDGFRKFILKYPNNIECVFYGIDFYNDQRNRILQYDSLLNKYITITNRLPRNEIVLKMSQSNILLVLANEYIDGSCTKVYDYFAVKRKILCVVNDYGTLEFQINNTQSGVLCNNSKEVYDFLSLAYIEWQQTGQVKCNSKNIEQYSRKEQTKKLAKILDEIIA